MLISVKFDKAILYIFQSEHDVCSTGLFEMQAVLIKTFVSFESKFPGSSGNSILRCFGGERLYRVSGSAGVYDCLGFPQGLWAPLGSGWWHRYQATLAAKNQLIDQLSRGDKATCRF